MKKYLIEKIYGAHNKEIRRINYKLRVAHDRIRRLTDENSSYCLENNRLLKDNKKLKQANIEMISSIEKIERNVRPARFDDNYHEEIVMALHLVDRPELNIIVGAMPLSITAHEAPTREITGYNQKLIKLDTRITSSYLVDKKFFDQASYELQVRIAKRCGEIVEHKLLSSQGWRCDEDFNDLKNIQ